MVEKWKLTCDMKVSTGISGIIVDAGTNLVSKDGGKTFRIEGVSALRVFTPKEILALHEQGILQEAG